MAGRLEVSARQRHGRREEREEAEEVGVSRLAGRGKVWPGGKGALYRAGYIGIAGIRQGH